MQLLFRGRRGLTLVALIALVVGLTAAPAAAASPTISAPASATVDRNDSVAITGTAVTANGATTAQVSLEVSHGDLSLAQTTGLTFAEGDGTQDAAIAFTGSIANVNAAIATLTYRPATNYAGPDSLEVQVTEGGSLYFPGTGHFYEFVSDPGITWTAAKAAAEARELEGLGGYLVTVTSAQENAFVEAKLSGQGWMGASDAAVEKEWRWVTGPEAGTQFWFGTTTNCGGSSSGGQGAIASRYQNWSGGEPNDCGGIEHYAHFLANGTWNDYPENAGGSIAGYVVEYGGLGGDTPTISSDSTAITVMPDPPGAPTGVSAVRGHQQATVSWSAPADNGGAAITGYRITASPGGATSTLGNLLSGDITGLTNGTPYTFTVEALNSGGYGPASTASSAVTPATVPGAPSGVAAVRGNQKATVSWTAPANNGSAITGYTVTVSPGGATHAAGGGASSLEITGLTNGNAYTFVVKATNAVGAGPNSSSAGATPATVPSAPTVTAVGGRLKATVSWTAPPNNGSAITSYVVTASPGGATTSVAAATTEVRVTGLLANVEYTFTVVANNDVGAGSGGAAIATTKPANPVVPAPGGGGKTVDGDPVAAPPAGDTGSHVALAVRPGGGVWGVTAAGELLTAGGAPDFGDVAEIDLNEPINAIAATPTGNGYYLLGEDGGVFAFGDAQYLGSLATITLNSPTVAMATTCSGLGYYIVTEDGGVFAFGDAQFHGSMAGSALNQGVFAIAPRCDNSGYWIAAGDGGVFAFGGAGFYGSLGGAPPVDEIVGFNVTDDEQGYWLVRPDGDEVGFGTAS